MAQQDDQTENFKNATAATLRAIAEVRHMGVTFSAAETAEYPTAPTKDNTRLPLPPVVMDEKARTILRGTADAKGLRLRHHDRKLHIKSAPRDMAAAAMFEALETARYKSLGMNQMKGVEQNLSATITDKFRRLGYEKISGRDDAQMADALHALARFQLTGEAIPANARAMVEAWTPYVEEKLGADGFASLRPLLDDQAAFAREAKSILNKLNMGDAPGDDNTGENETDETQTDQQQDAPDQRENDKDDKQSAGQQEKEMADDSDIKESADETEMGETSDDEFGEPTEGETPSEMGKRRNDTNLDPHGEKYVIYTTQFDEIVDADELADPGELTRLRRQLDQQMQPYQGVASKLANRLQRKLMAQQQRFLAVRPRGRLYRPRQALAPCCQPDHRADIQKRKADGFPRYGRLAAHRQFRFHARAADRDCGHVHGHHRQDPRALRGEGGNSRLYNPRLERRQKP